MLMRRRKSETNRRTYESRVLGVNVPGLPDEIRTEMFEIKLQITAHKLNDKNLNGSAMSLSSVGMRKMACFPHYVTHKKRKIQRNRKYLDR